MSDYRAPNSSGTLTWELPEGYCLGSVTMRLHTSLPPYAVYLTYEKMEMIEGRECRIASGMTGQGNEFHEAISIALAKLDASLSKQRLERAEWLKNPKPQPRITGSAPKINLDDLDLSTLDLGDL